MVKQVNDNTARHVMVLGINHTTSRSELRDRLLFHRDNLASGLESLGKVPGVSESIILSTCNRVEIYAVMPDPEGARNALMGFLAAFQGVEQSEFESQTYFYHCDEAVEHLFMVVSSLDSLVVGEVQILGQIKEFFDAAKANGNTGVILNRLFQTAVSMGKRVRTETGLGRGAVSISSLAIELAEKILGTLNNKTAMIIGAGEMSELVAKYLRNKSIGKIYFANRSLDRAEALSLQYEGSALSLADKNGYLDQCDLVLSSTSSPDIVLGKDEIKEAMSKRNNLPMFLIDIAVPKDVHPEVGKLYNVFLFNIDDLSEAANANAAIRAEEAEKARKVVQEEMKKYVDWYNALRIQPTLVSLRKQFDATKDKELERYAAEMDHLPAESKALFRKFADSLTNKFLHDPSVALKEMTSKEEAPLVADTITRLFRLKRDKS